MDEVKTTHGLGEMFFNSMKKYSDRVLLFDSDNDETITFSDILSQSIRTALKLKKLGITRNDIISTCSHNQKYSCVPIVASQFLGAITANFDPTLSQLDTVHLLKLVRPKIIFVSEEALNFMENCISTATIDTELVVFGCSKKYKQFLEFLEPDNEERLFSPVKIVKESDTAMILFSSGTTGLPKGICLSHFSLKFVENKFIPYRLSDKNPEVSLMFATFYWISTNFNFITCVANGHGTVICREFDPVLTWRLLEKYKVTFTFLAPYNATGFLRKKPKNIDVDSVDIIVTGSCPVNQNLMEDLRKTFPSAKILNIYGQTEFGQAVCYFDPRSEEEYNMQILKPLSCGKIRDNIKWKIVDNNSEKILGPNEEGELRIKSKHVMNGYYKMDSTSAFDSEGFLKSGDIAYYDEDNCIYIVDRIKEMFKYRGWHILPAIIENVIKLHPAVKDAAVVGIPHETDGDHPMAVVVLFEDCLSTDTEEILNFVNQKVADNQKLRAGVKFLKSLPKTATGKVKRSELTKMILAQLRNN